jgi:hypothetical protein
MCRCLYSCMSCIDMHKLRIDGRDNTPESHDVIKEYCFYVSDDREHDTLFVYHCFGLIYESF